MPKKKTTEEIAEIDPAWGAILCRKQQLGLTFGDIADMAEIGYGSARLIRRKPPLEWPNHIRVKVLDVLGLRQRIVIEDKDAPTEGGDK